MKRTPGYQEYHPRWYRESMSTYWWLRHWWSIKFILRELSSVAVAWFVIVTLRQIAALSSGPEAFEIFRQWMGSPFILGVNVVCGAFLLLHTITWFNLAPRAMVIRVRGKRIPDGLIVMQNYGAWFVVSGLIAWLVMGGAL